MAIETGKIVEHQSILMKCTERSIGWREDKKVDNRVGKRSRTRQGSQVTRGSTELQNLWYRDVGIPQNVNTRRIIVAIERIQHKHSAKQTETTRKYM